MATGTASEREVLESWLDFHRGVAVRKVADLTMSNAQTRLVPSQSTLAGLLHHLAATEHEWFQEVLSGQPAWPGDAPEEPDTSWVVGEDDTVADLVAAYEQKCQRSRADAAAHELDDAVPHPGLPDLGQMPRVAAISGAVADGHGGCARSESHGHPPPSLAWGCAQVVAIVAAVSGGCSAMASVRPCGRAASRCTQTLVRVGGWPSGPATLNPVDQVPGPRHQPCSLSEAHALVVRCTKRSASRRRWGPAVGGRNGSCAGEWQASDFDHAGLSRSRNLG